MRLYDGGRATDGITIFTHDSYIYTTAHGNIMELPDIFVEVAVRAQLGTEWPLQR